MKLENYPKDWKPIPKTRLSDIQMERIEFVVGYRNRIKQELRDYYSNESLAAEFGVHVRTIEKAIKNCSIGDKNVH